MKQIDVEELIDREGFDETCESCRYYFREVMPGNIYNCRVAMGEADPESCNRIDWKEAIRKMSEKYGMDETMEALREYRRRLRDRVEHLISPEGTDERLRGYKKILKPEVFEEINAIMRRGL